jgi:hypothetical protein
LIFRHDEIEDFFAGFLHFEIVTEEQQKARAFAVFEIGQDGE